MIKSGGTIVIVGTNDEYVCDVNGKASKIRNGTNSPVLYNIFEYYAIYARDVNETYWYDLFTNASKGNFPSKMYKMDEGNVLTAKLSAHNIQYFSLTPPTREHLAMFYEKCKDFISNTSGVACKDDVYTEVSTAKYAPELWSGSIPPQRQVTMVDMFVNSKAKEFFFTDATKAELKESLICKIFSGELGGRIKKNGHTIESIDGLYFKQGAYWIATDNPKFITKTVKNTTTTTQNNEEEEFVFRCSKNMSTSLKNRVGKGFHLERFQFA